MNDPWIIDRLFNSFYILFIILLLINEKITMSEITIKLSDSEKDILSKVLESYLSDMSMEITDTDSMDYREQLKARRTVIQKILKEIKEPSENK